MPSLTRLLSGIPPLAILVTFALGGIGGLAANALGLPLAMLMGAMVAVTGASALGLRVSNHALAVPQKWRTAFVPVIGVSIGAAFPPDFATQAMNWWITLVALAVFVPGVQVLGYFIFGKLGGLSPATSYFAAMPGGFIEALDMGEKSGADMQMLIMLQFLRLILCIVLIPIAFSIIEGHAVGASTGVSLGARAPLTSVDVAVLFALGAVGWAVAHLLRFPAAMLSGPLLLSGAAHALGLTEAAPPIWAVLVTQWIMGTSLGARLAGFTRGQAGKALRLSLVHIGAMLLIAGAIAMLAAGPVDEPVSAVILAFAPGGVSEMALVALSLQVSAVYVTLHHLARIILAVLMARVGLRWIRI
ncbi:AbrB family transcriptional regulator [Pararhodobacter marinus]|uniref:AbrB family transcriptional regulator n=1 Tax=Pararhodobacter marinus TaxID=2184063 RepID=UPI003510E7D4